MLKQLANKKLVDRFPFIGSDNPNYDYSWTEMDFMPLPWREAFGIQMLEELRAILVEADALDDYRLYDVKEKYESLRWYDNVTSESLPTESLEKYNEWLSKYIELSEQIGVRKG